MELDTEGEYKKEALPFDKQADLLLSRGLEGDRNQLIERLQAVNYYRLTGYLHSFRQLDEQKKLLQDNYQAGTTLDIIWNRYCFDRRLRMLLLDAIERIEVSIRTKMVHKFSLQYGPFGYCDQANFHNFSNQDYLEWRTKLEEETSRSRKEPFVAHFKKAYGKKHPQLPFWMVAELMSMGSVVSFFKKSDVQLKKQIANEYGVADAVLDSWVLSLYSVRNICAHHSRLWNRKLGTAPLLPSPLKNPLWAKEIPFKNDRVGSILLIGRYFLRLISPSSKWHKRVEDLLQEYCDIPILEMGMPSNWRDHPIWTESTDLKIVPQHTVMLSAITQQSDTGDSNPTGS